MFSTDFAKVSVHNADFISLKQSVGILFPRRERIERAEFADASERCEALLESLLNA